MTAGRRRQAIADAARAAGLGEIVRVHREHSDLGVAVALWFLASVGSVPAVIVSLIMLSEDSTTWQWPLLACATAMGVAYLMTHVGPARAGRQWVAVADGGLVMWSRHFVRTFAWDEAQGIDVGSACNLGDLRNSIALRRPVGAWTPRRVTGLTITGLVTAAAVWFTAVPIVLHVLVGERPTDLAHFARMCDGGPPFGRTAAYEGPAPHPIAVYSESPGDFPDFHNGEPPPEPDTVQLVGCARLTGKASPNVLKTCSYEGGHGWETYQGRYRIDVYEARTGRAVTSFDLDGIGPDDIGGTCPPFISVPKNAKGDSNTHHSEPSSDSYRAKLGPLVNG